mmetsp:Transcript_105608/g.315443  ORF Transcript_105608/g.315443 Transcript_105608/m.315443 type:complete len:223 (+) Transcript_105608:671-1339(+)
MQIAEALATSCAASSCALPLLGRPAAESESAAGERRASSTASVLPRRCGSCCSACSCTGEEGLDSAAVASAAESVAVDVAVMLNASSRTSSAAGVWSPTAGVRALGSAAVARTRPPVNQLTGASWNLNAGAAARGSWGSNAPVREDAAAAANASWTGTAGASKGSAAATPSASAGPSVSGPSPWPSPRLSSLPPPPSSWPRSPWLALHLPPGPSSSRGPAPP